MTYEPADQGSDKTEVRCLRAEMKLCADSECYHNACHEPLKREGTDKQCTTYERCKDKNIFTRCVPVE